MAPADKPGMPGTTRDDRLELERDAFDDQILERVAHGHVPDLRYAPKVDWFYNNPWRDPFYVDLTFGEQFRAIDHHLSQSLGGDRAGVNVLEVGCGPGHLTLELARAGYDVTGLDLSPACIEVARGVAASDPHVEERGSLEYRCADVLEFRPERPFDGVVLSGALHHFADVERVLRHVARLLRVGGIVVCREPTRDRVSRKHAAFVYLLRTLLSNYAGFFERYPLEEEAARQREVVEEIFADLRYEGADGAKRQSVNDNESGFAEMYPALSGAFEELHFEERSSFHHENIGGLRLSTDAENHQLSAFLRAFDRVAIDVGLLESTEFFFVGRRAEPSRDL